MHTVISSDFSHWLSCDFDYLPLAGIKRREVNQETRNFFLEKRDVGGVVARTLQRMLLQYDASASSVIDCTEPCFDGRARV